jgi:hypothetical protein
VISVMVVSPLSEEKTISSVCPGRQCLPPMKRRRPLATSLC